MKYTSPLIWNKPEFWITSWYLARVSSLKIKNINDWFLFFEFNLVRSVDDDNDGIGRLIFGRIADELPNSARRKID